MRACLYLLWAGFSSWWRLVAEQGSRVRGLQWLWLPGLAAPRHVGSSRIRDRTHVSSTARRILLPLSHQGSPGASYRRVVDRACWKVGWTRYASLLPDAKAYGVRLSVPPLLDFKASGPFSPPASPPPHHLYPPWPLPL